MSQFISESLTELFHLVRSLVPDGQEVLSVSPNTTVADALDLMEKNKFSQVPVIVGDAVLGVFSYRSFSKRLMYMGQNKYYAGDLPVDEFVEELTFVQPADNWEKILAFLDSDDAVLVGGHNSLAGIVTTMDVLDYLRQVASPFVILAEGETSLRRAIRACVSDEELRICALNALASKYGSDEAIPNDLAHMEFNDYAQIIGNRQNWLHFETMFGNGEWARKSTTGKLIRVRELRNDVFHFRRRIEQQDLKELTDFRDWLQRKLRAYQAQYSAVGTSEPADQMAHVQSPLKQKWNVDKFFRALSGSVSEQEVVAAVRILTWAEKYMPEIWWGEGKILGSFNPGFTHNGFWHQVIGVWTNGDVELKLDYLRNKPVFNEDDKRLELIRRFNEVEGIDIGEDKINKRPNVQLTVLTNPEVMEQFLLVLQWFVDSIKVSKKGLADRHLWRYQFWTQLLDKARERTALHENISASRDNWVSASSGTRGIAYAYLIRMKDAEIQLFIDRGDETENTRIFDALAVERGEIEDVFGDQLEWINLPSNRSAKIRYVIRDSGLRDQKRWPQLQDSLIDAMVRFSAALQPHINNLTL